jgi:hypothetical protein
MDGSRFDRLVVAFTMPGSRRRALGGLLAGAFGLLATPAEAEIVLLHGQTASQTAPAFRPWRRLIFKG